jgi:hypothetical protein
MITVDTMMSYGPCEHYPRSRVLGLWAGREALTAQQVAKLKIPAQDRIWALCAVLARLDRASLSAFARGRADRADQHAEAAAAADAAAAAAAAADAAAAAAAAADAAAAAAAPWDVDAAMAKSRREAIADLAARIEACS